MFPKRTKNIRAGAVGKSSNNQAVRSGIVEPPDTARRDRERFLRKGIVDSVGFFFPASNFRLIRLPMLNCSGGIRTFEVDPLVLSVGIFPKVLVIEPSA